MIRYTRLTVTSKIVGKRLRLRKRPKEGLGWGWGRGWRKD